MNQSSQLYDSDLVSVLKKHYLFENVEQLILEKVSSDLISVFLPKGETLFQKGEPSDALYLVLKGHLKAFLTQPDGREIVLSEIGNGEIVGEIQLLIGGKRTASISALSDTQLLKMPKAVFETLAEQSPGILQEIAELTTQRLRNTQLMTILSNYFSSCDDITRQYIKAQLDWIVLQRGKRLFKQGDIGDSLYFVVSGRLRIMIENDDGKEQLIGEVTQGENVGEMALITGENRTANVYALRDCELVKLSKSTFERLIKQHPQIMMAITQNIISRMQKRFHSPSEYTTAVNVAIVPVSPKVPLSDFSRRLVSALSAYDSTLHLSSDRTDNLMEMTGASQMSPENPQSIRLVTRLDEQESKYRFIIYQADLSMTGWTQWCLRRADKILLVADATTSSTPDDMKSALLNAEKLTTDANQMLVLLHPEGHQLPSNTRQRLSGWFIKSHHHIRWDTQADFERLARFISGRAIGLALSGGGARGFTHFGVYLALKEAGVPIDMIGGTSMGAFVGAQCAAEWTLEMMLLNNRKGLIESNPFKEFTPPIVSLLGSRTLQTNLKMAFSDTHIEDLWINFFCISSNISTKEMVIHQHGKLEKALRASAAIPGIAEPVLENNHLLVDGGLFNNLPGDIMRQFCQTVIAVDVSSSTDFTVNYDIMPSSWKVFWSRIIPFKKPIKVPSIPEILLNATLVNSTQQAKQIKMEADFYLRPPVESFKLLEFTALEKLVEIGYQYTKSEIENWKNQPK